MADRVAYLEAVVGADISSFRYAMQHIRNEVGILGNHINKISETARIATYAISAPLAVMGAGFAKASVEFEKNMRNINSIALMSEKQIESTANAIKAFSTETSYGASELADALYTVYSAGFTDQATAMDLMQVATRTAEAGLSDLTVTTEALASIMLSYSNQNVTATQASNMLTRTVQVGVGTMEEFANAFGYVLGAGATLGVNINELGSAMAFLTQRGFSASKAGTSLNNLLTKLIKPTAEMTKLFDEMGVTTGKELITSLGGLNPVLEAVMQATGGAEDKIAKLFSDDRGLRAVLRWSTDFETAQQALADFNKDLDNATLSAWNEQSKSLDYQLKSMNASFMNMAITIGEKLHPLITPFVSAFKSLFDSIANLDPAVIQLSVGLGLLAVVLPPLVWLFTGLLNPLGLVATAVIALATAFVTNFQGIRDKIQPYIQGTIESIQRIATIINDVIQGAFGDTVGTFQEMLPMDDPMQVRTSQLITITNDKSLYDIWSSDSNIQKQFGGNWNKFYDDITKGGTLSTEIGSQFTIGSSKTITNAWKTFNNDLQGGMVYWNEFNTSLKGGTGEKPKNFFSALVDRIAQALPDLQAELEVLKVNIIIAFTAFTSNLLTELGGILMGGSQLGVEGDTPFYEMFTSIFDLDFNSIAQEASSNLSMGLPALLTSLGTFFDSLREFVLDTAIPTLARVFGFGFAKLAVGLNDLIASVFGASDGATQSVSGYLADNVVTPFQKGMQEGFEGTTLDGSMLEGMTNGLLSIVDSWLSNLTVAGLITTLVVGGFVTKLLGAVTGSLSNIATTAVGGAFDSLVGWIVGGIVKGLATGASLFGGVATAILSGISGAIMAVLNATGISGVLSMLATGLMTASMTIATTIMGLIATATATLTAGATAIVSAIGTILVTAMGAVSATATWVVGVASSLVGLIASAVGAMTIALPFLAIAVATLAITAGAFNIMYGNELMASAELAQTSGISKEDAFNLAVQSAQNQGLGGFGADLIARMIYGGMEVRGAFDGRATGGYVKAGMPYMVGEAGRELFIPSVNGHVKNATRTSNMTDGNAVVTNSNNTNTIIVNGVQDVDGLLAELKRRGIKLQ